jgi:RNA polymerase sigma-70 factor (ECF subfamily)
VATTANVRRDSIMERWVGYHPSQEPVFLSAGAMAEAPVQPGMASDATLMARVARQDRAALGELVCRYQKDVWTIAYHCIHRPADADDVAQEAFLRLWRAAPRYRPTAALTTYLYRIVTNLCLDQRRRRQRAPVALTPASPVPAPTPVDPVEADERAGRVRAAVQGLPERQRVVLVMHRYQDWPIQTIAERTGFSAAAVESLLSRAYARLRQDLADLVD